MEEAKTIFITISRGALIRNLFHTGVVKKLLEKGLKVVVLTPYHEHTELFSEFKHERLMIEPLFWSQKEWLRGFFKELCKGAVFNPTVYARYRYSIGTHQEPSSFLFPLRILFFAPLRFVPYAKTAIRFLHSLINPLRAHDSLFLKYKPSLVFNTAAGADCGVLKSARRFGVLSVDMPKSWDNVTQALFPTKADYMIVWNEFMRDKVLRFQDYKAGEITITGIPQFDFYARKEHLLSQEDFCREHRLDPNKKIILYGSAGAELFDETKHILLIQKFIEKGLIKNAQILVRPHLGYRGDIDRFSILEGREGIVVDKTDKQNHSLRDHFDTSRSHIDNLFNSLHHADVCVNVASTLSLDALACGTEVVNFDFDVDKDSPENASVKRLFVSDYVKDLMNSGGTFLAHDEKAFLEMLQNILEKGYKKDKEAVIGRFMHTLDGKSAERVAGVLIKILNLTS